MRSAREFACLGDDEAIDHAAGMGHPHGLELWERERLVWRFEPSRIQRRTTAS